MKRYLCLAVLILCSPLVTHAQHDLDTKTDTGWLLVEEQLVRSLDSPYEFIVIANLENAIVLSVLYRDKINARRIVPKIIAAHRQSKNEEVRKTALAALHVIGSERALAYRRDANPDARNVSRQVAADILENYFAKRQQLASRPEGS